MPVTPADLLADPALRLRARTSHAAATGRAISWVSTTELPDPLPFLRGGELVMTTGMLERTDAQWHAVVRGLAGLPVAALCFGTGLVHDRVPEVVERTAEAEGLALIESPVDVPFAQISRWVADRLFAEQYHAVRAAVTVQDDLLRELLAGHGLAGMLRRLHHQLDAGAVAVTESGGRLLARYPRRAAWVPGPEARGGESGGDKGGGNDGGSDDQHTAFPIVVDDIEVARLSTQRPSRHADLLSFAASILGLELARHQAVLTGRRELVGQVVEDVLQHALPDRDATRRLAGHGLELQEPHRVLVARVDASSDQLRRVPWSLGGLLDRSGDPYLTALVGDAVMVLVPVGRDPAQVAESVRAQLSLIDPAAAVGVSEPRPGLPGLRLGFHEARQAAKAGPGVHRAAPLSATGMLLANLDLPLEELGRAVLAPLLEHDAAHGSALVATLRAFLNHDCQPAATARALVLHRNTLRYRLQLVERLTGRDLDRLTDRMELWFALGALEQGGTDSTPG